MDGQAHIRPLEIRDFQQVKALEEQVFALHRQARPDYFRNIQNSYAEDEFKALLAAPCPIAWAAEQDGRIVGLCLGQIERTPESPICKSRRIAFIEDLAVAPEYRRRGIAAALMNTARTQARESGAESMELHVWGFNREALALYEKLGFHTQYIRMEERL